MTKGAALYQFFSGFGMEAYPTANVPEDAVFPWLTYDLVIDSWTGGEVSISTNLWFYTESESVPNAKAQEIADAIGSSGKLLPCDGGYIWLKRGSPWCQSLKDETNATIKRRSLNITAEYLTLN